MARRNLVHGLKINTGDKLPTCETCIEEKQTREPFPVSNDVSNRTIDLLEIIYSDVCGPMRCASHSGAKYFVSFIDDRSRFCHTFFINKQSDVLQVFQKHKAAVETFTGRKIKILQSDNGGEYCNREMDKFLSKSGIQRRLTAPHTPQQNGTAERMNRTLVEMARCLMKDGGLPRNFWAEAINTACYIRNRCPRKALGGGIPFTVWTGKIPSVTYFQIFGTKAFVLDKTQKGKFDSRSFECVLAGYSTETKAYRLWCHKTRKIVMSRDIRFVDQMGFNENFQEFFGSR